MEHQATATVRRIENRLRGELETEAIDAARTGAGAEEVVTHSLEAGGDVGLQVRRACRHHAHVQPRRDQAAEELGATTVEYSAAMDANTCGPYSLLDGQTAELGSEEHDHASPTETATVVPLCRCVLVYSRGFDDQRRQRCVRRRIGSSFSAACFAAPLMGSRSEIATRLGCSEQRCGGGSGRSALLEKGAGASAASAATSQRILGPVVA